MGNLDFVEQQKQKDLSEKASAHKKHQEAVASAKLSSCDDCGAKVSPRALWCPCCGAVISGRVQFLLWFGVATAVLSVIAGIIVGVNFTH